MNAIARPNTRAKTRLTRIAVVGTYLPQRCGIATFSSDLRNALAAADAEVEVSAVALKDDPAGYDYPSEVRFEIAENVLPDYRTAADFLNANKFDVISLQHEFGIFGGDTGSYVLRLLQNLRMPVVTTLHTVLKEPNPGQRSMLSAITKLSDRVVVMSERAREILKKVYGVPSNAIAVIPHGVPDIPFLDTSYHKEKFSLLGKDVILSFGLISRGKGLEYVVEALPAIVAAHPRAVFVVVGETHPGAKRHEGEAYRFGLKEQARKLGVADRLIFFDQFIDNDTLTEFLTTGDIFVTPYLNAEQIVSGVLSFALGAGKAIVSTPYWYAEELLAEERGRLVPFRDGGAIAREVIDLLSNDVARQTMRKRAHTYGRDMVWRGIGKRYLRLFREIRRERDQKPRTYPTIAFKASEMRLPVPRFDHLRILTDDTGIFQHARFAIPDRDHGYCTDDNARALIVALMGRHVLGSPELLTPLAYRYLGFLQHAFNHEKGRFRNFMSFDRRWLEEAGSDDSHGRALWALGYALLESSSDAMTGAALTLFERGLAGALDLTSPRAWAFTLVGIDSFLRRYSGATEARRARAQLADRLFDGWRAESSTAWPWLEPTATYANGIIPHALIVAGKGLGRSDMVDAGLRSLAWLADMQTHADGHFVPVGNDGWLSRDGTQARFDQQPIEAQHMIDALLEARQVSDDARWMTDIRNCFEWFLGRNDVQQPVAVEMTGGCRDGVTADGVNQNQGAESTLAWLHSLMQLHIAMEKSVSALTAAREGQGQQRRQTFPLLTEQPRSLTH